MACRLGRPAAAITGLHEAGESRERRAAPRLVVHHELRPVERHDGAVAVLVGALGEGGVAPGARRLARRRRCDGFLLLPRLAEGVVDVGVVVDEGVRVAAGAAAVRLCALEETLL